MYYSTDQGKTWEGPFSEQEIETLKEAGVLDASTLYSANPNGPSAPPPSDTTQELSYFVMDKGVQTGPFPQHIIQEKLSSGQLSATALVWREGMPNWVPITNVISKTMSVKNMVDQLEGFSLGSFFSQVFSRHSRLEVEELCSAGTPKYTPHLKDVSTTWPAPWLFARLMLFCLILFLGFNWAYVYFENKTLVPGLLFVGNFGIPVCMFILFYELNVRRDVSLYVGFKALVGGGLLSMIISSFLFKSQILEGGAWIAGPIEETGKLVAAILIATAAFRNGRIHTGLLIGAGVGAGFAAFESAGYTWFDVHDPDSVMRMRAITAVATHVIWTAITAGAYWFACHARLQNGQHHPQGGIDWGALVDIRFLQFFIVAVALHATWNMEILWEAYLVKTLIWAVIGWTVVFILVGMGLRQVRQEKSKLQ